MIAIIAILAAILLPALQQARERANSTKCISNLKNAGSLGRMYLDSNRNLWPAGDLTNSAADGTMPWWVCLARAKLAAGPVSNSGGEPTNSLSWNYNLNPAFRCPSMVLNETCGRPQGYGSSSAKMKSTADKKLPTFPFYNVDDPDLLKDGITNERDIDPSERVWLLDTGNPYEGVLCPHTHWEPDRTSLADDYCGYAVAIHGGRLNLLNMSGSVASVQPDGLGSWYAAMANNVSNNCHLRSKPIKNYITPTDSAVRTLP